jgi:hypothetical protein
LLAGDVQAIEWATRDGITYIPRTDENTLAHTFRPAK